MAAGAELEEALEPFAPRHWREALGSSGTVSAVSEVLAASGVDGGVITPAGLRWLIEHCLQAGHIDQLELPGLTDERRAVIAGGVSLLYTLATQFGIPALKPARGALRQGVIIDLHDRLAAQRAPGLAAGGRLRPGRRARRHGARAAAPLRGRHGTGSPRARRGAGAVRGMAVTRRDADPRREKTSANWPGPATCTRWA